MTRKNKNPAPTQPMPMVVYAAPVKGKKKKSKGAKSRQGHSSGAHDRLVKAICAITDPFCDHALGAKWPDIGTQRSLAFTARGTTTITTDAAGGGAVLLVPVWNRGLFSGTLAGTVATFAGPGAAYPGMNITAAQTRLVTGGFTIANIGPVMTSAGVLIVAAIAGGESVDVTTIDVSNYAQQEIRSRPFAGCIQEPAACVFRPGGTLSREFNGVLAANPSATCNTQDWNAYAIVLQGGIASSAVLRIEYVFHFEILFPKGDSLNLAMTPAAKNNTFLQTASADITTALQTTAVDTAKQVGTSVMKKAMKTVGKLAISAIAARFGGAGAATSAYALTDAMDVD